MPAIQNTFAPLRYSDGAETDLTAVHACQALDFVPAQGDAPDTDSPGVNSRGYVPGM
jgi:hypothetical protein